MYGTIARIRVKQGMEEQLRQLNNDMMTNDAPPGILFGHVYRSDADPTVWWLAVGFESKEAYHANANDPAQHERYLKLRALLDADPEWNDGEIVASNTV
jgi:quinol monooxygenase YgiN